MVEFPQKHLRPDSTSCSCCGISLLILEVEKDAAPEIINPALEALVDVIQESTSSTIELGWLVNWESLTGQEKPMARISLFGPLSERDRVAKEVIAPILHEVPGTAIYDSEMIIGQSIAMPKY